MNHSEQAFQAAERMKALSPEERAKISAESSHRAQESYERFEKELTNGICPSCKKSIKTFSRKDPCLHWLFRPNGFRKNDFTLVYQKYGYRRISAFVRWAANTESPITNINDLKDEHSGRNFIDFSARWRHIVWSFSCNENDFTGNESGKIDFPHYHFQMRTDNRPFINYKDFHVPFTEEDLFLLNLQRDHSDIFRHGYGPAKSFQDLPEDEASVAKFVDSIRPTKEKSEADVRLDTLLFSEEGFTEEEIREAFEEAEKTGRSKASVLQERYGESQVTTIVSPGDSILDPHPRSERKRR